MIVGYRKRRASRLVTELKSAERRLKREEERRKTSIRRESLRNARHELEYLKKNVESPDEEEATVQDIVRVMRTMRGIAAAAAGSGSG